MRSKFEMKCVLICTFLQLVMKEYTKMIQQGLDKDQTKFVQLSDKDQTKFGQLSDKEGTNNRT